MKMKKKELSDLKEVYKYTDNSLVKVLGIGREKEVTFVEFKSLITLKAEVSYIDFPYLQIDPTMAIIRTKGEVESKKINRCFC